MSAEMAAESASDGGSAASASTNAYPSDLPLHAALNGTTGEETTQLQATDGGPHAIRSVREQQLIARGRHLLQTYQQKTRERREIMDEMCFSSSPESELSAVEILGEFTHASHLKNGFGNGSISSGSTALVTATANAVVSDGSNRNWLAASSNGSVASHGFQDDDFEFEKLQSANEQLLELIDTQLATLRSVVGEAIAQSDSVQPLWSSLSQLIQQKRKTEAEIGAKVHTRPLSSAKSSEDSRTQGDFDQIHALQNELSEAKSLISELTASVNAYESKLAEITTHSVTRPSENGSLDVNGHAKSTDNALRKLQNRVLEKDELLLSLRTSLEHVVQDQCKLDQELRNAQAVIERLEGEKAQMEKAAADKRTLLHRAYVVKARQLDLLCKDVELPSCWERVTDENGIIYYRQNDRACAPELDDPRVGLALQRVSISSPLAAPSSSPRSAAGRMEQTYQAAGHHRASDRKSSSSSFDSTVSCEDIAIPPEDGTKHEVDDFETPLPDGWEMRVTTAGAVFFVNRNTNVTTWKDPRKRKSRTTKRASAPADPLAAATQRLRITIPERRSSNGDVPRCSTTSSLAGEHEEEKQNESTLRRFDVVFQEKGPIGIHFQANMPDAGATVRRLLPRMAAARTEQLVAFDRLVAVNKNPVDSAPFRYVMLLLQGGLRPLTLTFERDLTRCQSHQSSEQDRDQIDMAVATSESDHHLDEEVVLDESGPNHRQAHSEYGYDGSRSNSSGGSNDDPGDESARLRGRDNHDRRVLSGSAEVREEDFSIADKIITNLFSLFWTPPEQLHSQVETV